MKHKGPNKIERASRRGVRTEVSWMVRSAGPTVSDFHIVFTDNRFWKEPTRYMRVLPVNFFVIKPLDDHDDVQFTSANAP